VKHRMERDGHKWRVFKDLEVIVDVPILVTVACFMIKDLTDKITENELLQD